MHPHQALNFMAFLLICSGLLAGISLASPLNLFDRLGERLDKRLVQMRQIENLFHVGNFQRMPSHQFEVIMQDAALQNTDDVSNSSQSDSEADETPDEKGLADVIPILGDIERIAKIGEILLNVGDQIIPILLQNLTFVGIAEPTQPLVVLQKQSDRMVQDV